MADKEHSVQSPTVTHVEVKCMTIEYTHGNRMFRIGNILSGLITVMERRGKTMVLQFGYSPSIVREESVVSS
jgi:hypothetical protein